MMNNTNVNTKYKTAMCRHWENTGNCQLGPKCHFAHGKNELRSMGDPLPMSTPPRPQNLMQKNMTNPGFNNNNFRNDNMNNGDPPSNFKTSLCKYFEKGSCKYENNCNFAHGDEELRMVKNRPMGPSGGMRTDGGMGGRSGGMNPLINRGMMMSNQPQQYQQMGSYQQMGGPYQQMNSPYQQMNSPYQQMDSPYQQTTSPYMQSSSPMMQQQTMQTSNTISDSNSENYIAKLQISFLIQQVEDYHNDDEEILETVQAAKEQLQQNNIQGAAKFLNEIIQRPDKSPEDNENYNQFITNIQKLGVKYSSPQQSQTMNGGGPGGMNMSGTGGYNTGGYQSMQQPTMNSYNTSMMQQPSGGMTQSRR